MNPFQKFKPGVSVPSHLLTAGLIWTLAGLSLMLMGWFWSFGKVSWVFEVGAVALGSLKSIFILNKVARRNIKRILQLEEGTCIGGVYSTRMWVVVLVMIIMGRLLRMSVMPPEIIGVLYVTIGWGLLISSRLFWTQWMKER